MVLPSRKDFTMSNNENMPQYRTSRFLRPGEDRMVQLVQDTLRSGGLHPVDSAVAEQISSANRDSGGARQSAAAHSTREPRQER